LLVSNFSNNNNNNQIVFCGTHIVQIIIKVVKHVLSTWCCQLKTRLGAGSVGSLVHLIAYLQAVSLEISGILVWEVKL
jgi:hypothetical protein